MSTDFRKPGVPLIGCELQSREDLAGRTFLATATATLYLTMEMPQSDGLVMPHPIRSVTKEESVSIGLLTRALGLEPALCKQVVHLAINELLDQFAEEIANRHNGTE